MLPSSEAFKAFNTWDYVVMVSAIIGTAVAVIGAFLKIIKHEKLTIKYTFIKSKSFKIGSLTAIIMTFIVFIPLQIQWEYASKQEVLENHDEIKDFLDQHNIGLSDLKVVIDNKEEILLESANELLEDVTCFASDFNSNMSTLNDSVDLSYETYEGLDKHEKSLAAQIEVIKNKLPEVNENVITAIEALHTKVSSWLEEKEGKIKAISSHLEEKEKEMNTISDRLEEKEGKIKAISSHLEEKEKEIIKISSRLEKKEKEINTISSHLEKKGKRINTISDNLEKKEKDINKLSVHLQELIRVNETFFDGTRFKGEFRQTGSN